MTACPGIGEVERFRTLIARHLGLRFEDAKLSFLADVLRRRLEATDRPGQGYLLELERALSQDELGVLAQELTVPETYFFRNIDQFRAFAEVALPDRARVQASRQCLRVLSAGCASGEEAYSMAMLVLQAPSGASWNVSIRAVDINPAVLRKAAQARFSGWSLRETPVEIQRRWFRRAGSEFALDEAVQRAVTFERRNLVENNPELWHPGFYDVVFCRNVIMYFTPQIARRVIRRIADALLPGGYLFLGHAETLRGLSQSFHLRHTHGTFYYQRKDDHEIDRLDLSYDAAVASPNLMAVVEGTETWIDAINQASERIRKLVPVPTQPTTRAAPLVRQWDLGVALDLLRRERFEEGLHFVGNLPRGSDRDPDVVLLHAVLYTHSGQLSHAERACDRLLEIDEMNAGAHYVLALCRESAGDRHAAANHDRLAAYLDPAFAMPRLHLGLLARRAGEAKTARRELGQALTLLEREDASRLLLFGGGFSREMLLGLCRAELDACGGRA